MSMSGDSKIETLRAATCADNAAASQDTRSQTDSDAAWRTLAPTRSPRKALATETSVPPGARLPEPPADLVGAIESLLFVAEEPVEPAFLAGTLSVGLAAVQSALETLAERLRDRGIRVQHDSERVQLISAPEFGPYVERFLGSVAEQRLSNAALETLAIIAYRQPVTRSAIEQIRGVNSERALSTLRARDLVQEVDRAETVGHPVLFGTTMRFLEYFGLEHPGELSPLGNEPVSVPGEHQGSTGNEHPEEGVDD